MVTTMQPAPLVGIQQLDEHELADTVNHATAEDFVVRVPFGCDLADTGSLKRFHAAVADAIRAALKDLAGVRVGLVDEDYCEDWLDTDPAFVPEYWREMPTLAGEVAQ